jgi:hypothetical protein
MTDTRSAVRYYTDAFRAHYGFEATTVAARRRQLVKLLAKLRPRTVEVGRILRPDLARA